MNSECKSGAYLYGLPSKELTVLRFYLKNSYVLRSLGGLPASTSRCLVSSESSKKQILSKNLFMEYQIFILDDL